MKKFLLQLCLLVCGLTAVAQSPINLGIHGGTSSNRINFKDLPLVNGSRPGNGYMIGAFMRINLGMFYLEPAFNYSKKKSTAEINTTDTPTGNADVELANSTFDIPLMVGLNILDLSIAKFRVYAGPQFSTGKLKNLDILKDPHTKGTLDANKVNWSGKIGAGVDIWKLTFDIDYEKGFHKMAHELKAPRSYNFTLGLKII